MGLGVGAALSYLYYTPSRNSSKSQLQVGGQYSNTKSFSTFVKNNAWFRESRTLSSTRILYSGINNEFTSEEEEVSYNVATLIAAELLMYAITGDLFVGGEVSYKDIRYEANNEAGEDFLHRNGVVDERSGGLGLALGFDTRANKYYPSRAAFMTLKLNASPSWLGAVESYYNTIIDARHYARGLSEGDVLASQVYGRYSSDLTPDSGLPTISGKTLLRGFAAGQFKARYLSGAQTEYRYTIGQSRFRITAFFGIANLAGGSAGVDGQSREDDGWYAAGGPGIQYTIQPKTGVVVRVNLTTNSEGEQALYVVLNQAF